MCKPQIHNPIWCLFYCHLTLEEKAQRFPTHLFSPHVLPSLTSAPPTNVAHYMMRLPTTAAIDITHSSSLKWFTSLDKCIEVYLPWWYCTELFPLKVLRALVTHRVLHPVHGVAWPREICLRQTPFAIGSLHLLFSGDSESRRREWFLLTDLNGYRRLKLMLSESNTKQYLASLKDSYEFL